MHNIWQEKDLINATCKDTRHGLPAALSSAKKHDKIHLLHATRKEPSVFLFLFHTFKKYAFLLPFRTSCILPEEQAKEKVSYADYRFLANIYIYIYI